MNKRALLTGLFYSVLVIGFKLYILLGGYTFTRFGFNYAHVLSVFCLIPFFIVAVKGVRDKDLGGVIGGKQALKTGLTVLAIGMLLLSIYNYFECGSQFFKEEAIKHYNGETYLTYLKEMAVKMPDKVKAEDFPKIILQHIAALDPAKSTTFKLFPLLIIGGSGAFVTAMFMKRNGPKSL